MRRRDFITLLGGAAAWPLATRAQQAEHTRRIAIIMPYAETDAEYRSYITALRDELRARAWIEGRNIQFDVRWTTDNMDRIRSNATDVMQAKPDVVLAIGGRVVPVLMRLSKKIPIVVPGGPDPVGVGWVQSIARPGGNVTGFTFLELSIFGKMLELLKQIDSRITNVLMVYNSDNPNTKVFVRAFETAAAELAIQPVAVPVHRIDDIARAVRTAAERQGSAILIPPDVTLQLLRIELVDLIAKSQIPAIYGQAVYMNMVD
jgi:putative ABC transport system substrate-binding protein